MSVWGSVGVCGCVSLDRWRCRCLEHIVECKWEGWSGKVYICVCVCVFVRVSVFVFI